MGLKEILMLHGLSEEDATEAVAKGLPQFQANVAYYENMRDLDALTGPEDFND